MQINNGLSRAQIACGIRSPLASPSNQGNVVRRLNPSPLMNPIRTVNINYSEVYGYGFAIKGPAVASDPRGIFVSKVVANSEISTEKRISVGDMLVSINDVNIATADHATVLNYLKDFNPTISVGVVKNAKGWARYENRHTIHHMDARMSGIEGGPDCAQDEEGRVNDFLHCRSFGEPLAWATSLADKTNKRPEIMKQIFLMLKPDHALGLTIVGGCGDPDGEDVIVNTLVVGGLAHIDGQIHEKDRLVQINGVAIAGKSQDEVKKIISSGTKSSTIKLTIARSTGALTDEQRFLGTTVAPSKTSTSKLSKYSCLRYFHSEQLACPNKSGRRDHSWIAYGLQLAGPKAHQAPGAGVFINRVIEGSLAAKSGGFRLGDRVVSVNGWLVDRASIEDMHSLVQNLTEDYFSCGILSTGYAERKRDLVHLEAAGAGFAAGFGVELHASDFGLFVSEIDNNSPAAADPHLLCGDMLVTVDGLLVTKANMPSVLERFSSGVPSLNAEVEHAQKRYQFYVVDGNNVSDLSANSSNGATPTNLSAISTVKDMASPIRDPTSALRQLLSNIVAAVEAQRGSCADPQTPLDAIVSRALKKDDTTSVKQFLLSETQWADTQFIASHGCTDTETLETLEEKLHQFIGRLDSTRLSTRFSSRHSAFPIALSPVVSFEDTSVIQSSALSHSTPPPSQPVPSPTSIPQPDFASEAPVLPRLSIPTPAAQATDTMHSSEAAQHASATTLTPAQNNPVDTPTTVPQPDFVPEAPAIPKALTPTKIHVLPAHETDTLHTRDAFLPAAALKASVGPESVAKNSGNKDEDCAQASICSEQSNHSDATATSVCSDTSCAHVSVSSDTPVPADVEQQEQQIAAIARTASPKVAWTASSESSTPEPADVEQQEQQEQQITVVARTASPKVARTASSESYTPEPAVVEQHEQHEQQISVVESSPTFGVPKFPCYVRTMYTFQGDESERQLSFKVFSVFKIAGVVDADWWFAQDVSTGDFGRIPSYLAADRLVNDPQLRAVTTTRVYNVVMQYSMLNLNGTLRLPRPVVLLGHNATEICNQLVAVTKKRLNAQQTDLHLIRPVWHTSRQCRASETQGKEYHFKTQQMMKDDMRANRFVQVGSYRSELYGLSIKAIQTIAERGAVPLVDISLKAVKRLHKFAGIHPLAIYVHNANTSADSLVSELTQLQETEHITHVVQSEHSSGIVKQVFDLVNDSLDSDYWISDPSSDLGSKPAAATSATPQAAVLKPGVPVTTRPPRDTEQHGQDYYFVSLLEFAELCKADKMAKWGKNDAGYYYGILKTISTAATPRPMLRSRTFAAALDANTVQLPVVDVKLLNGPAIGESSTDDHSPIKTQALNDASAMANQLGSPSSTKPSNSPSADTSGYSAKDFQPANTQQPTSLKAKLARRRAQQGMTPSFEPHVTALKEKFTTKRTEILATITETSTTEDEPGDGRASESFVDFGLLNDDEYVSGSDASMCNISLANHIAETSMCDSSMANCSVPDYSLRSDQQNVEESLMVSDHVLNRVTIARNSKNSFGLTVTGGADYDTSVPAISYVGSVNIVSWSLGEVRRGDAILCINGKCMVGVAHDDVIGMLRNSQASVDLLLLPGGCMNDMSMDSPDDDDDDADTSARIESSVLEAPSNIYSAILTREVGSAAAAAAAAAELHRKDLVLASHGPTCYCGCLTSPCLPASRPPYLSSAVLSLKYSETADAASPVSYCAHRLGRPRVALGSALLGSAAAT